MNEATAPWAVDVGVEELTDTDLLAARNTNMNVSDPSRELHRMADALIEWRQDDTHPFESRSDACDYALRVELAAIIDAREVRQFQETDSETIRHTNRQIPFVRQDFDIEHLIPPEGTHEEWMPDEPLPLSENGYDEEKRNVNLSTAPTVYEMVNSAIAEGMYENFSAAVVAALRRVTRTE
jgi:Arc/MetJ-type ribon-helix-helix transcriptional regulator